MIKILMQKEINEDLTKNLEKKYDLKIYFYEKGKLPGKEVLEEIEIYTGWGIGDALKNMPNVKWIHVYSAGVDRHVKTLSSMQHPPRFTNNRGTYGVPLTEHTLALLFAVNHRIKKYVKNQADRKWEYAGGVKEIYGSTAGVIGFGDVGKHTAKLMNAMGARVLVNRLHESDKPDYVDKMFYGENGLDDMLSQCDFALISLPGTEDTRHLFDKNRMLKMKKGAVIINVGRGYIIDCDALADLIDEGHIHGAGLDVTDPEPLPDEHRLWDMDRVILTPHVAGSSPKASARTLSVFEKNLKSYLAGDKMPNEIDLSKGY